jgi:hypothetical protein
VELPNGNIWEPISHTVSDPDEYTLTFSAIPHKAYDAREASTNMILEGHHGPWYPVDERGVPVDGAPTPEERQEARAEAGRNLVAKITATPLVSPSVATVGVFHPADHPVDYQGRFDEAPLVRLPNGDVGIATAVDGADMVTVIGPE